MSFEMKRRPRRGLRKDIVTDGSAVDVTDDSPAHSGLFGLTVSAPPADLVTSDRLKSVRFDLAQPKGYYTVQVDALVQDLAGSLSWYEDALYGRDQGIHSLQTELDRATSQESTLRAQIEVFRVQGSVTVGADGEILRKSQVSAADSEHVQALAEAKGDTAVAEQKLTASAEEVRSLREWADVVIPQTEQIAATARDVQAQLEVVTDELAAERSRTVELSNQVAVLQAQLAVMAADRVEQVRATAVLPAETLVAATGNVASRGTDVNVDTVTTDGQTSAVEPASVEPYSSEVVAETTVETAPARSDAIDEERDWREDPELPVGVTLPRAKFDRQYIPAGPGDPLLVARRSPLTVWAPELQTSPEVADQPAPEVDPAVDVPAVDVPAVDVPAVDVP
ncbi:hypothetical protein, partial [Tessaracoccus sp.]